MPVGDLLTGPWQIELRETLFDGCDTEAGLIVAEMLDGFGVPPTRNADVLRPMTHGLFASPQYLGGRTMTVGIVAQAATYAALIALMESLGAAWAPVVDTDPDRVVELAFTLGDASTKYLVFGKPMRAPWGYATLARTYDSTQPFTDAALCEFLATDPRIYDLTLESAALAAGTATGGHGWPHGWPHGWGSASPGSATATNDGNIATYPSFVIAANASAFSNPTLTNVTTGQSWSIALSIPASETLEVDFADRTVLLNGTADRSQFVTRPPSEWWAIEPGANTIELTGSGTTGTATVQWRDAYLI